MLSLHSLVAGAVILAGSAVARTDLQGCTYYDSVVRDGNSPGYATRVWYVPGSGEICDFLDCGGGRAPPKTTVPGCAAYSGTDTYSPEFLNLKTIPGAAPETTAAATTPSVPPTTSAATVETGKASGSETASETAAVTTPEVSNSGTAKVTTGSGSATTVLLVSSGAAKNGTATTGITSSTPTNAGVMPTAQVLLAAGIAACAGLL